MTSIKTRLGTIKGLDRGGIQTFLGLPFAAPPVGKLRFQPPRPAARFSGAFDATRHPNRCHQPPYPEALSGPEIPGAQDEDCLYLNVYTPAADGALRPVMFWIHGGAYIQGSANEYDGTVLARDNDVVVVTINYRLNVFGFLDLSRFGPDYAGSASLGFQDQVAALNWVRANITNFGGDPGNVTIFGESAGAGSVLSLLATPTARGLFHKAIAFSPVESTAPPIDSVPLLAQHLGCDEAQVLTQLMALDQAELFGLHSAGVAIVGAAVDGTVVTQRPLDAIRAAGPAGVPLIAGCCKDEGTYLADAVGNNDASWEAAAGTFAAMVGSPDTAGFLAFLDELLPGAGPRERLVRLWYDAFRATSLRCAAAAAAAGAGGWVFNFDAPASTPLGVTHASDVAFTFNVFKDGGDVFGFHDGSDPVNQDLANRWSATFAAFARSGDPNGAGLPDWPQYKPPQRHCLVLDRPPRIASDPDGQALRQAYGIG